MSTSYDGYVYIAGSPLLIQNRYKIGAHKGTYRSRSRYGIKFNKVKRHFYEPVSDVQHVQKSIYYVLDLLELTTVNSHKLSEVDKQRQKLGYEISKILKFDKDIFVRKVRDEPEFYDGDLKLLKYVCNWVIYDGDEWLDSHLRSLDYEILSHTESESEDDEYVDPQPEPKKYIKNVNDPDANVINEPKKKPSCLRGKWVVIVSVMCMSMGLAELFKHPEIISMYENWSL